MLQRLIRQVAGGASAGRRGRRPAGRSYGRRGRAAPGGTGARVGSMVERFLRTRR